MDARVAGSVLVVGGAIFALLFFNLFPSADGSGKTVNDAYYELFKFCVTVVIVGGVAMIWGEVKRREEAETERREAAAAAAADTRAKELARNRAQVGQVEKFFRDLAHTYNQIKMQRRILKRALLHEDDGKVLIFDATYWAAMERLNELQLQLEFGRRLARLAPGGLVKIGPEVEGDLGSAEDYLREVTKEYENRLLSEDPGGSASTGEMVLVTPDSRLASLLRLSGGGGDKQAEVYERFFRPLDDAYGKIGEEVRRLGGGGERAMPKSW